jgi:mRNA interferase MazF
MLRGEIRIVDLDPAQAGEANRRRPAVLVSNDGANTTPANLGRGVVTVVPITTNTDRVYPFQVLIPSHESGLDRDSEAQAEQVRPVSVDRITNHIGTVAPELMLEVDEALRLHLAI